MYIYNSVTTTLSPSSRSLIYRRQLRKTVAPYLKRRKACEKEG
jgi:hypothetical protein